MRILGIDPGGRIMGYGCVEVQGGQVLHVAHGVIQVENTRRRAQVSQGERLKGLFEELQNVFDRLKPDVVAIEKVFFAKNVVSALKLGEARGIAVLMAAIKGAPLFEYSPTEVKRIVAGNGQSEKEQVARMVQVLLGKQEFKSFDASDALAIAVCHARSIGVRGVVSSSQRPASTQQLRNSFLNRQRAGQSLAALAAAQLSARKKKSEPESSAN